ncbi:hypothetical protein [Ascidiimonas aurantiaca]|uniref:hypothetical protein n=1 Tax=Ascidiimonas aurantiaca TaxID=1685432 RepID=UPI0030EC16E8
MKTRSIVLLACVVLYSSCILRSLNPFYTKNAIVFEKSLTGNWEDQSHGRWDIQPFKQWFLKENKNKLPEDPVDVEAWNTYREGYFISYTKKGTESFFLAISFKVNDQVFIDFIPYYYEESEGNELVAQHLVKAHSVARLNVTDDEKIKIEWLSEKQLNVLLEKEQIQMKHEIVGPLKEVILTASSQEIYQFLKKYSASSSEKDWKSAEKLTLKRVYATP